MTFRPRRRCAHPGCLALARIGKFCDYHRGIAARIRAEHRRAAEQRRNAKRRKLRIKAAIRLLRINGYSVTTANQLGIP